MIAIFDEFEEYETAESKFAHTMDNLQPLILNNSNEGMDWKIDGTDAEHVFARQRKNVLGSKKLWEVTEKILNENLAKGNLKFREGKNDES